jgi:putative membrane protein
MHNDHWHEGLGNGNWWWIPMVILMVAFWGGLIWIGFALLKRNRTAQLPPPAAPAVAAPSKPTAYDILAERLARGEIEPDDYRQRLEALRTPPST